MAPEKENQCCLNSNCDLHEDTCFVFNGSQYHRPASSPCCQSLARKRSHYGPVSFIRSYRGQARLITVCAGELQAHQPHSSPQAQLKSLMDSTLTATQHPIVFTLTSVETVCSSLGLDEDSNHTHNIFYAGFLCLHRRYWWHWVDGLLLFMLLLITCLWGGIKNKLSLSPSFNLTTREKRGDRKRQIYRQIAFGKRLQ